MSRLGTSLRHAWNAFVADRESQSIASANQYSPYYGRQSGKNPNAVRMRYANDRTILTSIYTRMAVDAAGVEFRHVRLDDNGQYKEELKSFLNDCLTVEANIDQASIAFFLDVYLSLMDNGCIAIVPTDTTLNPNISGGWDVQTMRVGEILNFAPKHVYVSVYNQDTGERQQMWLEKGIVAIVYNPFHTVMNDGGSVLQRLVRKLALLDTIDEASASGKLDLLIQLPYTVRGDTKKRQAADRHKLLEDQLKDSALGIGYIDQSEKVVQLNRPVENSLVNQVEYLVKLLFSQLGLTPEIMDGTAKEEAMLHYMNRTIAPLNKAVQQAMIRTFLTKTARTQGQSIMRFWDPFQLLPLSQIAEIADKLIRNEVLTANELRPKLGYKPSEDPNANKLGNPNMPGGNAAALDAAGGPPPTDGSPPPAQDPNQPLFDEMNKILDNAQNDLAAQHAEAVEELAVDQVLMHGGVYDPVARRQRYLRDRQLKGKTAAVQPTPGPKLGQGSRRAEVGLAGSGTHAMTARTARERQLASNARQVAQIKDRLDGLHEQLRKLLAEQKASSSSASTKSSASTSSNQNSTPTPGPSKPKTAAQKAAAKKALKKAQDARAKEQKQQPDQKQPMTTSEKIDHLRTVISDTEDQLRAALERARTQTASNSR